jgi:uncharacterized protein YgbK (DUF1537 family)
VNLYKRFRQQGLTDFGSIQLPISADKATRAIEQRRRFIVADAATKRDLACLTRTVLRSKHRILLAGSAAMAVELAKLLRNDKLICLDSNGRGLPPRTVGQARCNVLVIAGSNSPVTKRQVEKLIHKTHAASLTLNRHTRRDGAAALAGGRHAIIHVPSNRLPDRAILRLLRMLDPIFLSGLPGSLVLVGGDTAFLICRCLRPLAIAINGEIVPGLAWGIFIGGLGDGLSVCTKPGGFGNNYALVRAVEFLAKPTVSLKA